MTRIEDYALLGDLQTAALVSNTGSIDWLCVPRFDSPACFAALLDTPEAGRWKIAPAAAGTDGTATSRRYSGDTLILETDWVTTEGTVRVVDFMPPRGKAPDIVRIVVGISGAVPMVGDLRLRFDYGRVVPWVRRTHEGIEAIAGPDSVWLTTDAPVEGRDFASISEFTVRAGDRVPFVMTWAPSHLRESPKIANPERSLVDTATFWERWRASGTPQTGPYAEAVTRSLITLKALTYEPTGGIVAAPTTSLPELIGGSRNWDYRYCWLRDSALSLQALISAGYLQEAKAWREWLLRAVAGDPSTLQIMYSIDGTRRIPEYELPWLAGYEKSTPVRIGNAAADQLQLDVWGEVIDGLHTARQSNLGEMKGSWHLELALMNYLESNWQVPDNGLWEMRGPTRHFTHSKVMAWVAADRMAKVPDTNEHANPVQRWAALRDEIRTDVMEHGFNSSRGTFVQSYGGTELDASLLTLPRVGFVAGDDPRMLATIDAISRELTQDGFVMRYRNHESNDGLSGAEGVFLACSFWMVDALSSAGRVDDATTLYERLLGLRNDVGLLSEEWDPVAKRQLGNAPQAFSHFPLVTSAMALAETLPTTSVHPSANLT